MVLVNPSTTLNIIPDTPITRSATQRILVVGQQLTGTATSGALVSDVGDDDSTINALFGQRSHIANVLRSMKVINRASTIDAIPLDDAGGATQAASTLTVTGTATADGRITVTLVSRQNFRVNVDVVSGDTATVVATKIVTAFTSATNYADAPFTIASSAGVVTATASNGGTIANGWLVQIEGTAAGISIATTAFSGGATDPSVTNVLDVTGSIRYQGVVWPSAYDEEIVKDFLDARFNVNNAIRDGRAFVTRTDTLANLTSLGNLHNSQNLVIFGDQLVNADTFRGGMLREMPDVVSGQFAAIRSLRFTAGASISQFLTTNAANVQFGSDSLASVPYFNTPFPSLFPPRPEDEFTESEVQDLEDAGVSVISSNPTFTTVIAGEVVTTYKTNAAGSPDTSYQFLNTVDSVSIVRERFVTNLRASFVQHRLTRGELIPNEPTANESSIFARLLEIRSTLVNDSILEGGIAAERDFKDTTVVEITNLAAGTVRINMEPLLISQLRAITGTIQVNFGDA